MTEDERMAIWQKAQQVLEDTAGVEDALRARQDAAGRGEHVHPLPHQPKTPSASVGVSQRPIDGWQRRMEAIVDQRLAVVRSEMGELADEIGRHCAGLANRMTKTDTATAELLMGLERRIADLEQRAILRPVKPKLVTDGGPDDAA